MQASAKNLQSIEIAWEERQGGTWRVEYMAETRGPRKVVVLEELGSPLKQVVEDFERSMIA